MRFFTTNQHALENGIKCCVYGRSGVGKTRLIPTAPRPFILSAEGGTLSIAEANIKGLVIASIKDLQDAYMWVKTSPEAGNYDTICLDSVSEMAEALLSHEKSKSKDARAAYGEMQDQVATQIRLFRDLPGKHVYFTAKAELRKQPDGTEIYTGSMPGNKTAEGLPYYFDEFFYLGVAETPHPTTGQLIKYNFLQTQPDTRFQAKDRSGALAFIEKPDLGYIFNKIRAKLSAVKP